MDKNISVIISGLASQVPTLFCSQTRAAQIAQSYTDGESGAAALMARRYYGTRIEKRHLVILKEGDQEGGAEFAFFQDDQGRPAPEPTTAQRMALYAREAPRLAVSVAREALRRAACQAGEITHLITVSCTGFEAPGFEFDLIDECGLRRDVGRLHVGFMGCHGSFNALRVAESICQAAPGRKVLIVSVELCSVHMQYGSRAEDIVANSLFADGAGACVVETLAESAPDQEVFELGSFLSFAIPDSKPQMGWHIRDHGFVMDLKREIPQSIYRHLPPLMMSWLKDSCGLEQGQVGGWGIHPGGPRIVEAALESMNLPIAAAAPSFHVLKEYGNMSSATLFFILAEMSRCHLPRPWAMIGFGPGLSVEAMLIR